MTQIEPDARHLLRLIKEVRAFPRFLELVPYPADEEDAFAIGEIREELCEAVLAYSLIALRRLDDFLKDSKVKPDDVILKDYGILRDDVLQGQDSLLSKAERDKVSKTTAHFTNSGLVESWEYDENWLDVFERVEPSLARLLEALSQAALTEEVGDDG